MQKQKRIGSGAHRKLVGSRRKVTSREAKNLFIPPRRVSGLKEGKEGRDQFELAFRFVFVLDLVEGRREGVSDSRSSSSLHGGLSGVNDDSIGEVCERREGRWEGESANEQEEEREGERRASRHDEIVLYDESSLLGVEDESLDDLSGDDTLFRIEVG